MDSRFFTLRVPKKWAKTALVAVVTAMIVAPLTAVASHSFSDVPNSNIFHADIEWLADAGVTLGCNPPANTLYCPKNTVTRESMAAFLHRLADNQVVDAGELEGRTSAEMLPIVRADYDPTPGGTFLTNALSTQVNTVNITVPVAGTLWINGSVFINNNDTARDYTLLPMLNGSAIDGHAFLAYFSAAADGAGVGELSTLSYTMAREVAAGTYTVSQNASGGLASDFFYNKNNLVVQFIPGGQASVVSQAGASNTDSEDGR